MKEIKIRTRYQRMALATKAAEILKQHDDPKVQELALCIVYALGAPTATLNNVIDQFPKSLRFALEDVAASPTKEDYALQILRQARKAATPKTSGPPPRSPE